MLPDPNIIRQKVIIIRGPTKSRESIKIIVTQEARAGDGSGEILSPTIQLSGLIDSSFESFRFALDLGVAFIVAAHYAQDWSQYVIGKR